MTRISALLIAAGESFRMGRSKPLLPWQGVPLIEYQVLALAEAGISQLIVVLGHQAEAASPFVRGAENLRMIINPRYQEGKTTSIKLGLREVERGMEGVLLLAVDQPRPAWVHQELLRAFSQHMAPVTQPTHGGKRGHPIIFHSDLIPELQAITEETRGILPIVDKYRAKALLVPMDTPIVVLDLNTEQDYQRAQELFAPEDPARSEGPRG